MDVERAAAEMPDDIVGPGPQEDPDALRKDTRLSATSIPQMAVESAALLTLFSLLIFIEGGIRLTLIDVKDLGRPEGVKLFPPVASFIASICELVFGFIGLMLGLISLIESPVCAKKIKACVLGTVLLNLFVFAVYNLADPIYRIRNLISFGGRPVSDVSLFRGAESMALLTRICFTIALFAGQVIFMLRLASSSSTKGKWSSGVMQAHAIFWNANVALAGLWTLVLGGGVLSHTELFRKIEDVNGTIFFFLPHAGTEPGFTIATGIVMILWGVLGVALALLRRQKVHWFLLGSLPVALLVYLNFTLVQLGQLRFIVSDASLVATNTAYVFALFFLSCFFLRRCRHQKHTS
ncbi:unnamed protein product [Chondrus crispus]|uniref:Uncharacterized protein n=1 Tax=Chondrus crispus TaxID=2769 RepID=R7QQE3_CHOCR|nr:unnamed protein product [Chondrus crispus]CDF39595.1 unnamed protein product [Chondrus crispus]|eukprot:XP_005709889.1 unnamed protein product [Chondrus crispus]